MLSVILDFPFYYIFLCILLGVLYAYLLYKREGKITLNSLNLVLFFLRTIFIAFLSFLLLAPFFKSKISNFEKPIVIIAKDNSESIKEDINNKLDELVRSLQDFEVFLYSFSDKTYEGLSQKNDGLLTNYSSFFSELSNKFENRNVAAVIMASDGCYNTGSNPEYLSYDYPVYPIALGDTIVYKDVRIDYVLNNDIAFFGNTFPLEISLASTQVDNEVGNIKVFNNGVKVYEESITFSKAIDYNTYSISLPADKIGLQQYIIELGILDGEENIINNSYRTYIDIVDTRNEILLLKDGSHPDLAAYKSVLDKNQNYKVEVKDISENIIINKYNLAVIFGLKSIPLDIINSSVPLLIFNANSNLHSFESGLRFKLRGGMEEVNAYKYEDFSKFSFSSELLRLISDAPPLYTPFGIYDVEGIVDIVLAQKIERFKSNKPLLMIQQLEAKKIAFFLSEGWWKWKLYDYSLNNNNLAFDELFSKLTQYLLLIEDKSLFRIHSQKQYEQNKEVVIRASLFNQSYELVNNKEINLEVRDKENRVYDFQFSKEGGELIARLGVLDAGSYSFTASVQGTDMIKNGVFDVKEIQLEQLGLSANHQLLYKISSLSSGKLLYPNNMQDVIEIIKNSKKNKTIIHHRDKFEMLIDFPLILLIFLMLISIEWFVRKYNGLI